ncbi:YihY/virulence factor BrkB family protein [Streptomyces gobiensis]|uniref:YihY/virulence factor BrkB family protein n=1 Tax=Streptomyces gobiensis TaxID=2875706 RepID=UPI001E4E91C4|nr:YihY/virulence factor BrkB family protein [Streptomyces gobiensis]UGY94436.1 YihY/virulence factor BrkB family protein [Streptomyces gobiensis]
MAQHDNDRRDEAEHGAEDRSEAEHSAEVHSEAERHEAERREAEHSGEELAVGTGPSQEVVAAAPDRPTDLHRRSWWAVLRRTGKEFSEDELPDRSAALTYFGVLSIFPAILVLVSLLGVIGAAAARTVLDNIQQLAPGAVRDTLNSAVEELRESSTTGGILAVVGLVGAVWAASAYVAAFIRAANAVYDLPEGRPIWKTTPLRLGLTVLLMILLVLSALIVVFTGPLAERAGETIGLGDTAVTVWAIAKWPVLVLLVVLMIALLYWAAPNVKERGFRWLTPGSFLAVLIWLLASVGFALYVANFGSYNRTYGTLAGVIIFLIWLWLTNLAILLGLEFDAELSRERAIAGGHPREEEPYVRPRDTRKWPRRPRGDEQGLDQGEPGENQ